MGCWGTGWQEVPAAQVPLCGTVASFLFILPGFRLEADRSWPRPPAWRGRLSAVLREAEAWFQDAFVHAVPCSFTLFQLPPEGTHRPEFPAPWDLQGPIRRPWSSKGRAGSVVCPPTFSKYFPSSCRVRGPVLGVPTGMFGKKSEPLTGAHKAQWPGPGHPLTSFPPSPSPPASSLFHDHTRPQSFALAVPSAKNAVPLRTPSPSWRSQPEGGLLGRPSHDSPSVPTHFADPDPLFLYHRDFT